MSGKLNAVVSGLNHLKIAPNVIHDSSYDSGYPHMNDDIPPM